MRPQLHFLAHLQPWLQAFERHIAASTAICV